MLVEAAPIDTAGLDVYGLYMIMKGLAEKLFKETEPERSVILREDGVLKWREELSINLLRERLTNISWLDETSRDKIVAFVFTYRVPQVDVYVEALIHQMMEKDEKDRPTSEEVVRELEKYLTDNKDEMIEVEKTFKNVPMK